MPWIYENNNDDTARYILGEHRANPLICIGVNPSTARPRALDPTLTRVKNRSQNSYDGWIMLNLYPQRATNPNNMHLNINNELHTENIRHIQNIMHQYPNSSVWAAWGGLIKKRPYLKQCLEDIVTVSSEYNCCWKKADTRSRNPHHPIGLRNDVGLIDFCITNYLETL